MNGVYMRDVRIGETGSIMKYPFLITTPTQSLQY
jgi:hypothetical protein